MKDYSAFLLLSVSTRSLGALGQSFIPFPPPLFPAIRHYHWCYGAGVSQAKWLENPHPSGQWIMALLLMLDLKLLPRSWNKLLSLQRTWEEEIGMEINCSVLSQMVLSSVQYVFFLCVLYKAPVIPAFSCTTCLSLFQEAEPDAFWQSTSQTGAVAAIKLVLFNGRQTEGRLSAFDIWKTNSTN